MVYFRTKPPTGAVDQEDGSDTFYSLPNKGIFISIHQ
jgi:hypothetical protein